jgi:hypothetical protein
MSYPVQCPAVYDRILPDDLAPTHVRCTYIEGHEARHSYETLKVIDDVERAESRPPPAASVPVGVALIAAKIHRGELDEHLEFLLSAGHSRKLARRGVAGFTNGVRA